MSYPSSVYQLRQRSPHDQLREIKQDLLALGVNYRVNIAKAEIEVQECPCCHGDLSKSDNQFKLNINYEKSVFHCHRCGEGGTYNKFKEQQGLKKIQPKTIDPETIPPWEVIWNKTIPLSAPEAEPARKYFASRGLQVPITERVRFGISVKHFDESTGESYLPAIVSRLEDNSGKFTSVHQIFLDSEGNKANVLKQKKFLGRSGDSAVSFGVDETEIALAEGLETSLAVHEGTGLMTYSCLSSGGMKKFEPPSGVKKVHIFADNDINKTGQRAAFDLANRLYRKKIEVYVHIPDRDHFDFCAQSSFDFLDVYNRDRTHLGAVIKTAAPYDPSKDFWVPPMRKEAFYGIVGRYIDRIFSLTEADKKSVEKVTSFSSLLETLNEIEEPHSSVTSLIEVIEGWREKSLSLHLIDKFWNNWLPKFFYFDDYSVMDGRVNIEELREREGSDELTESDKTFLSLLTTIDASLEEFETDSEDPEEYERLVRELESASNGITQEVFKYWSQNQSLRVQFNIEPNGKYISTRIYNDRHSVTVPFNERSRGFIWFFSFFAYFSNISEASSKDLVLLLDEPGLSLHAKAQEDFLKLINDYLAPSHQVVYTTHSPFMIEPSHLERVRTVEDVDQEGTKISEEVLRTDKDTIFPLQAALGYSLAQTLFVGPNTLLVEGPSDILYLQLLSELAVAADKEGLDPKWVVVPVGGADKLATFVSLLGANQLNLAVLMDISNKDGQRIQRLKDTGYLGKDSLLTFGQFLDRKDADVEDLFEESFYLQLVNGAYKGKLTSSLKMADIKTGSPRITVRVGDALKQQDISGFNHYLPSVFLLKNQATLLAKVPASTIDKAVEIFSALNALQK